MARKRSTSKASESKTPENTTRPDAAASVHESAGYLSLTSRSEPGRRATAILSASGPVGGALLSSGLGNLASGSLSTVMPLLSVTTAGFDVRETLHRFSQTPAPSAAAPLAAWNRVGEPVAQVAMRWLACPDGFAVTPGQTPPVTALEPTRSQRFAMLDGLLTFRDHAHSTVRFFGAGRTFPQTVHGATEQRFAGTATVLEGTGVFKGAAGVALVAGRIGRNGEFSVTLAVPVPDNGAVASGVPAAIDDVSSMDPWTTVLSFVANSAVQPTGLGLTADGPVALGELAEDLWSLGLDCDAPERAPLRAYVGRGSAAGRVTGPLHFDPSGTAYISRLTNLTRRFTFTTAEGREVAAAEVDVRDGTAFREARNGRTVWRLAGYGLLQKTTGTLAGVQGLALVDITVDPAAGRVSSSYMLRLTDPYQQFRSALFDVTQPAPPAHVAESAAGPAKEMPFVVTTESSALTAEDKAIAALAEDTVKAGNDLREWFAQKEAAGDLAQKFEIVRQHNPGDSTYGFFDKATVLGRSVPVMGVVQEMFFDRQKVASAAQIRPQLREFVLKYFARVSHSRRPEVAVDPRQAATAAYLKPLSWKPEQQTNRVGFGYQQLYYKRHDTGEIGKFEGDQKLAMSDWREVGPVYDWLLVMVEIFNFNIQMAPFGADNMKMQMPMKEVAYLASGPQFIIDRENPEPGVLAEYGFGYGFVPYAPEPSMIAYGPGHFAAAVKTIRFRLHDDGRIMVRAVFVVNRPDAIAKVDVDPLGWTMDLADKATMNLATPMIAPLKELADQLPLRVNGLDPIQTYIWLANTVTGGAAANSLGINKESLERFMMVQHFAQHYEMLSNAATIWRQVDDWTAEAELPDYCRTGKAL